MYDFSVFEFSNAKIGLCAAILCAAIVSGLSDIFRIHNMFNFYQIKDSIDLSKLPGAFNDHSAADWEIRPLFGKRVPRSSLIVPILAIGLIVSSKVGSDQKLSAIGAGNSETVRSASFFEMFILLCSGSIRRCFF